MTWYRNVIELFIFMSRLNLYFILTRKMLYPLLPWETKQWHTKALVTWYNVLKIYDLFSPQQEFSKSSTVCFIVKIFHCIISMSHHSCLQVTGLQSWHARSAVLGFLQVAVFCNYFTLQAPQHKETIREFVMHMICDDKLEVSYRL